MSANATEALTPEHEEWQRQCRDGKILCCHGPEICMNDAEWEFHSGGHPSLTSQSCSGHLTAMLGDAPVTHSVWRINR